MTACVAMLLPAPGRFSTMNCWPSRSESDCAMIRATMSVGPPAGKPTITRTGRVGYSFACDGACRANKRDDECENADDADHVLLL